MCTRTRIHTNAQLNRMVRRTQEKSTEPGLVAFCYIGPRRGSIFSTPEPALGVRVRWVSVGCSVEQIDACGRYRRRWPPPWRSGLSWNLSEADVVDLSVERLQPVQRTEARRSVQPSKSQQYIIMLRPHRWGHNASTAVVCLSISPSVCLSVCLSRVWP